jgi:hypothetical protein
MDISSNIFFSSMTSSDLLMFFSLMFWKFIVCCTHIDMLILFTSRMSFRFTVWTGCQCVGLLSRYLKVTETSHN